MTMLYGKRVMRLPEMELGTNFWIRTFEGNQCLYAKSFVPCAMPAGGRAELVFDGIDTLADVFLNGKKVGEADNMFIAHRFDAFSDRTTGNVLRARIPQAVAEVEPRRAYEYFVRTERQDGTLVKEKRVYSPGANLPEELDAAETTCVFSKAELGNAPVRFAVRPANCWGVAGRAISG